MAEKAEGDAEVLFRAPKRRKIQRKRQVDDSDEITPQNELPSNHEDPNSIEGLVRLEKRAGNSKTGIAFSSNDKRTNAAVMGNEVALVPATSTHLEAQVQNDRFIRPTGRAGVFEDKHMMAYVDSKLAEMRSAKPPNTTTAEQADEPDDEKVRSIKKDTGQTEATFASEEVEEVDIAKLKPAPSSSRKPVKSKPERRRRGYVRDEKDVARDALIDQILQESQVPIYDRSTIVQGAEADGQDHDEAVAEAFKAEFLEELEARKRRKANTGPADSDKMPSGPKLGGSRSQRARMRLEEERKTAAGGKK